MQPDDIYDEFIQGFSSRQYVAGLILAIIDFAIEVESNGDKFHSISDLDAVFPIQERNKQGKQANVLTVLKDGSYLSLRPFYNNADHFFRAEMKRFDYPHCPGHATQAWPNYRHWIDSILAFSPDQRSYLRDKVANYVLDILESHEFDPSTITREPSLFHAFLENVDVRKQKGEKTGAAFQGIVFGFLRADNPHLQIEIRKVRSGSKRLQRVGDVDGWDGEKLSISAEVKQYAIDADNVDQFQVFAGEVAKRAALGVIAALEFTPEARSAIRALGLIPLDIDDMMHFVELWDPMKQRIAVSSFVYYVKHIEQNTPLINRVDEFIAEHISVDAASENKDTC